MSILSIVEILFFAYKFGKSFFKIKISDSLPFEKKNEENQEPELSADGTINHLKCNQKIEKLQVIIGQIIMKNSSIVCALN